jgi:hypothetical protein
MRGTVLPVFAAALAAAAVLAGSFGLVSALPQPTRYDRIAVDALRVLEQARGRGSRISIDGHRLLARCTSLSPRRKLIELSDGAQFVLRGSRIRAWSATTRRPKTMRPDSPAARAAIADLAGSYALYARELSATLERGEAAVVDAGGTYVIVLARRPSVELAVDRASLRPLRVRFRAAGLAAHAVLLRPVARAGGQSC